MLVYRRLVTMRLNGKAAVLQQISSVAGHACTCVHSVHELHAKTSCQLLHSVHYITARVQINVLCDVIISRNNFIDACSQLRRIDF